MLTANPPSRSQALTVPIALEAAAGLPTDPDKLAVAIPTQILGDTVLKTATEKAAAMEDRQVVITLTGGTDGNAPGESEYAGVPAISEYHGRADQVALLSVPRHYDPPEVLAWQTRLTQDPRISDTFGGVGPLSYAGYWHPWVSIATASPGTHSVLRDVPPDGPVAGMIAARELARGARIAPAGVPLNGVVRLTSDLSAADQVRLFDAHANLLVHQPGAFTALSAHTLTGARYTFEVRQRPVPAAGSRDQP